MALKEKDTLVAVFDTEQESEAMVVQGLLESAGIESLVRSLDAPQDVLPVGGVEVLVAPANEEEARQLIAESMTAREAESEGNDEDEEETSA